MPIQEGGLQLQDLNTKLKAIKIKWFKQMLETEHHTPWKSYLAQKFKGVTSQIPGYNLKNKHYPIFTDTFYNELFSFWSEIHYTNPIVPALIPLQQLWYNTCITIDNKVILNKNWHQHGIRYIHDIVVANGEILKQKQLEEKFVFKCKQIEYQGIISAIPKE